MEMSVARDQILGYRVRAQQLHCDTVPAAEASILDFGAQDTGPDGGLWALAIRGVDVATLPTDELATAWTIRGAPHLYRRSDLPSITAAVTPFSEEDAGKRIFDATKPLQAAGIANIEALDTVAAAMRSIVTEPMVKGELSTQLTKRLDPPYLRFCRPCNATHSYEMPFRLAALRAGLELQAGTSPPVLQRIRDFEQADEVPDQFDVIRCYLRLLGPATHKHVADFLDAPVKDVKAHWPADAVPVIVGDQTRWLLADDADGVGESPPRVSRLLGPYDLYLQTKDRPLLVDDPTRAKTLWPALGRPGAVLIDGEIAGTWRPRKSGKKLKLAVELWSTVSAAGRRRIVEQAERLAAFRQVQLTAVDINE